VAFVAIVVAALGLSACGGSGSSSSISTSASSEPAAAKETSEAAMEEATAEEEGGAKEASAAGELTPPGTELAVGETATLSWVPPGEFEPAKSQRGIELEGTVTAIEEGSAGDLKNIELEPSQEGATPFYVRLKIEAPTSQATPANENPAVSFTAIDDRKQEQSSVIFLGNFKPCEEVEPPKPFADGASYETCLTYLINGGGSIQSVQWDSGPAKANQVTPYFERPVVWSGAGE
jgi:hypothetical protein